MSTIMVANLVKTYVKEKKKNLPMYSQRAIARDIGISPAFLSNVMNGKKCLPPAKLSKFSEVLGFTNEDQTKIRAMISKSENEGHPLFFDFQLLKLSKNELEIFVEEVNTLVSKLGERSCESSQDTYALELSVRAVE